GATYPQGCGPARDPPRQQGTSAPRANGRTPRLNPSTGILGPHWNAKRAPRTAPAVRRLAALFTRRTPACTRRSRAVRRLHSPLGPSPSRARAVLVRAPPFQLGKASPAANGSKLLARLDLTPQPIQRPSRQDLGTSMCRPPPAAPPPVPSATTPWVKPLKLRRIRENRSAANARRLATSNTAISESFAAFAASDDQEATSLQAWNPRFGLLSRRVAE